MHGLNARHGVQRDLCLGLSSVAASLQHRRVGFLPNVPAPRCLLASSHSSGGNLRGANQKAIETDIIRTQIHNLNGVLSDRQTLSVKHRYSAQPRKILGPQADVTAKLMINQNVNSTLVGRFVGQHGNARAEKLQLCGGAPHTAPTEFPLRSFRPSSLPRFHWPV